MTVINESGLYSLILSSRLPSAKRFKRWVTSEVLPAIRRHGVFAMDDIVNNTDTLIEALQAFKAECLQRMALEEENAVQKQQFVETTPEVEISETEENVFRFEMPESDVTTSGSFAIISPIISYSVLLISKYYNKYFFIVFST